MTRVLPKGWEEKTLGEVCSILNGLWTGKKEPFCEARVLRNTNFTKDCKLDFSDIACLQVEQRQFASRELKKGDLLLEKSGGGPKQPVGRIVLFNKDEKGFSFSNFTSVLRIKDKESMTPYFLHWFLYFCYLSGVTIPMQKHTTGIRNLQMDEYKNIIIPIPSLPEQKRIVEKLDKIFAAIDKAKENTTKNLQNAKEVFDSFLDNVFTEKSASWTQKALGDILSKEKYSMKRGPFGSALRKSFFVPQGIRVFEQYNPINNDPHWKRYFISQEKYKELEAFTAQAGDLLVSCSGSLGKIVELPQNTETGIINQALLKIKLEQTLILNSFFIYWFRSPHVQTLIREKTNGVAIPNLIAVKELKKIKVPVPSRSIQEQIVKKLNFLRAKTQELEQIYTKKLADLDELKQSVLQQAFSGKL